MRRTAHAEGHMFKASEVCGTVEKSHEISTCGRRRKNGDGGGINLDTYSTSQPVAHPWVPRKSMSCARVLSGLGSFVSKYKTIFFSGVRKKK